MTQKAQKGSAGRFASVIEWINFGPELALSNGQSVTVTNRTSDGILITFDLSLAVTGNPEVMPQIVYYGVKTPTFGDAPFGNVDYIGIPGEVALYTKQNPTIGNIMEITITVDHLRVTGPCGQNINEFIWFTADPETTNKGLISAPEIWAVTSNGMPWNLVQNIPSISDNTTAGPLVSGVGTQRVMETGELTSARNTSSNVFATQQPTQIIAKTQVDGGREGFTFGIMFPRRDLNQVIPLDWSNINWIWSNATLTLPLLRCPDEMVVGVRYQGMYYESNGDATIIDGITGTYVIKSHEILVSTYSAPIFEAVDLFFLHVKKGQDVVVVPYGFGLVGGY